MKKNYQNQLNVLRVVWARLKITFKYYFTKFVLPIKIFQSLKSLQFNNEVEDGLRQPENLDNSFSKMCWDKETISTFPHSTRFILDKVRRVKNVFRILNWFQLLTNNGLPLRHLAICNCELPHWQMWRHSIFLRDLPSFLKLLK